MEETIQVLLIEDSPLIVQLVRQMLGESKKTRFVLSHAGNLADGIQQIEGGGMAAVLLDLTLPDSHGLDTFLQLQKAAPQTPTIIFTSVDDEELSLAALNHGAADYLVKSEVNGSWLARSLVYAIQRARIEQQTTSAKAESSPSESVLGIEAAPDAPGVWKAVVHDRRMVSVVTLEAIKERLLQVLRRSDAREVHIHFSKVEYISNAAISMLLIVQKRSKATGKQLVLCGVSPQVYDHFASRRFDKVFDIRQAS